jgi:hypothetical protein
MNCNSQTNILPKKLHNGVRIIDILSESKLQFNKPKSIFNKFRLKNNKKLPIIIHHQKNNTLLLKPNPFFEYETKTNNKKKLNLILGEYDDSTTIPTIQNTQTINTINHSGNKLKKNASNLTSLSISPYKFKNNKLKKDFSTINTDYKVDKKKRKKTISRYELNTEILKHKLKLGEIKIKKAFINVKTAENNITNEYMKIKLQLNNQFKKLFQKNNNNNKKDLKQYNNNTLININK